MKSALKIGILILATATANAQELGQVATGGNAGASATATQQPVYIVNQPAVGNGAGSGVRVYSQPTTVVEATPMVESRADNLRRSRLEVEANTERRIVEKLEASRIEDEQTRLNRLFGQPQQQQLAPQTGAAAGAVAGAQATGNGATAGAQAGAISGVGQVGGAPAAGTGAGAVATAVVNVPKEKVEEKKEDDNYKGYVGLMVGYPDYPGVRNVRANVSAGAMAGLQFENRLGLEGFFNYSSFEIDDVTRYGYGYPAYGWVTTMDQYNVGAALKYSILPTRLTPVVGGIASYTYRTFTEEMSFVGDGATVSSHAMDLGGLAGLDVRLTDRFYVGADFRYMMNVANRLTDNRVKNSFVYRPYVNTKPIEDLSYYIMSLNVRFLF